MENTNQFLNTNEFKVVGTLKKVDTRTGKTKDNKAYLSAIATVESVINDQVNEYEISFYANQMTKNGEVSKLYETYLDMETMINKKVEINGELRENRYWNKATSQMTSAQQLSGRWIRTVSDSVADEGSFIVAGFVARSLSQKINKAGEIYRYDLTLGQVDYTGAGLNLFTLHVNPQSTEIIRGVEGYAIGATVQVKGVLNFITVEVEAEDSHGGFGQKIVRKYTNRQRNFYITGGSDMIEDDTTYSEDAIHSLTEAYKNNDLKITENAKRIADNNSVNNTATPTASHITKRQTSLI